MSTGGDLPCAGGGGGGIRLYWQRRPFLFDRPGSALGRLAADRSGQPPSFLRRRQMQTGYRRLDAREIVRRGDKNAESADGPMTDVGAVGFKAGEVPELFFFRRVMGRPAKDAPNMVPVTFRMPKELRDAIDAKARAQGQTRGEMGREVWTREVGL